MTDSGAQQPSVDPQEESAGRPSWLIPAIVAAVLLLAVVVIALVATNDSSNDEETAIVVDMSPAEIRELQTNLTDLGYYDGPINGVYNQKTVDAVKDLQRELGVTVDGIVGPETLAEVERQLGGGGGSPSTTAGSTPTTGAPSPTETSAPAAPTVQLTIDGGATDTFVVTRCDNPGETTLTLDAQTEDDEDPIVLAFEATDGAGSITLSGGTEAEGTVDEVMVGDTGEITASGMITPSDDGAEPESYELRGNCA